MVIDFGLGRKIKFEGTDKEGNPYIIAPICLVDEWHNVSPFSRHPDSELTGGGYVNKENWQAPVALPLCRDGDTWVVEKEIWDGDDPVYRRAESLHFGTYSYKIKLKECSFKVIKVRKITRNFWATSFGIYSSLECAIAHWYKLHPEQDCVWAFESETHLKSWCNISPVVSRWNDGYDYEKNGTHRWVSLKTVVKLLKLHKSVRIQG